jgi:hypothetical protein
MAVDPVLRALARAAEADELCPPVRLATAGQFIFGTPRPTSFFFEASESPLQVEAYQRVEHLRRSARAAAIAEYQEVIGPALLAMVQAPIPEEPRSMTIGDAQMWSFGERDGVRLPVVRVDLEAVQSWWIGGGERIEGGPKQGWWLGVGVSFPLP